jgi:hypothetical protein
MFSKKETINKSLDIVEKLVPDKDKKQDLASDVVQNELVSGSAFVRNARPMIVYIGLFVILSEVFGLRLSILSRLEGDNIIKHSTALMEYFLFTWSGVVSVYIGGRTVEKAKMRFMKRSKKD